jgi:hypothetical protein
MLRKFKHIRVNHSVYILVIILNHRSGKDVSNTTIENRDAFEPDTGSANTGAILSDHDREKI